MLQNVPVLGVIPQIIGGLLIIICIIIIINRLTIKSFVSLFFVFIITFTTILNSNNLILNVKDSIYYITFVLFSFIVVDREFIINFKQLLESKMKYLKLNIILGNLILIIALFSKNAYFYEWGDGATYFSGFTYMPHVVAALCILLILFVLFYKYYEEKEFIYYIYIIIPVYCILKTGARAYIVPLLLILFSILVKEIGTLKSSILCIIFSPGLIIAFINTSMFKKFEMLLNFNANFSLLHKLTSGRSEMWSGLLYHYNYKYNFFEKLIGRSFDNIYEINYIYSGMNVWAHNDVINLLLTTGIIGVIIYVQSFYNFYKMSRLVKVNIVIKISYLISFVFLALMNGLYVQIAMVFCLPLYWIVFDERGKKC